jgi:hypothetical protein
MAMELTVPLETVCRVIAKARELEAPTAGSDDEEDDLSDSDDEFAVDDDADSGVEDEVRTLLEDLADEEVIEVLALALVGRGTYDPSEWDDALEEAGEDTDDAIEQLLDMPMLAAYLDAGLSAFDMSCGELGQD